MVKTVYRYDEAGYYSEPCIVFPSPLEEGVWLMPADTTADAPPAERADCRIRWDGTAWQYEPIPREEEPQPTLDESKAEKLAALKRERDRAEEEPITAGGHLFDFDEKARERIHAAIIALEAEEGASLTWTCADDTDTLVTADELRAVIRAAAERSNALHLRWRTARAAVLAAQSRDAAEEVTL